MKGFLLKILLIIVVITPSITYAQNINIQSAIENELSVNIQPEYPRPNQTVFISLNLYTADLNSAKISWYVNDSLKDSGTGNKKFNTLMGAIGENTNIRADVTLQDGTFFSKEINLRPASVDLVWESDSYTPPFYKGRALHSYQGRVKVVAMPNFGEISPEKLVYKWSNNAQGYETQSGYGKNVFILNNSMLGVGDRINLLVTDPSTNLTAENSVTITPIDPEIVFYEISPYFGLNIDRAITPGFKMSGEELQILAAPYFITNDGDAVTYTWRLNSQNIDGLKYSRTAVFRKPENESGNSIVYLTVSNENRLLQEVTNKVTIRFDK